MERCSPTAPARCFRSYRVLIRRSKGDQEGQGQEVAIPRGYRLRPVEAVQAWLAAAEISSGPVFRAVALARPPLASPLNVLLRSLPTLAERLSAMRAMTALMVLCLSACGGSPSREKARDEQDNRGGQ
jgi:hypothetical protein